MTMSSDSQLGLSSCAQVPELGREGASTWVKTVARHDEQGMPGRHVDDTIGDGRPLCPSLFLSGGGRVRKGVAPLKAHPGGT